MSRALRVQLKVPGGYRDLWLYKNRLFLWSRRGEMLYLDLSIAAKHLNEKYGVAVGALAQTLIFRNDWKVGEQQRSLMRIPAVEAAFLQPFKRDDHIVAELPLSLFRLSSSEEYSGAVLDTSIYADRLYFATPDGLLESYINSRYPDQGYGLNQQAEFRASKLSVRYAAINASAEDQGLHFARVRFFDSDDEIPEFKPAKWRKIADYSLSSSYAARNLLNYTEDSVPHLYRSKMEEAHTHQTARYEEQQVIGYEQPEDIRMMAYSAVSRSVKVRRTDALSTDSSDEDFTVLGNSNYHLLVAWDGRLRVVDLRAFNSRETEALPSPSFARTQLPRIGPYQVLETYPISGGFVVELYDSLWLITRGGSYALLDEQVARVRTYSNSLRHKEVVGIIHENEVSLIGFYLSEDVIF